MVRLRDRVVVMAEFLRLHTRKTPEGRARAVVERFKLRYGPTGAWWLRQEIERELKKQRAADRSRWLVGRQ